MAEFLLELLSEEIPAGLQPWAETAFGERFTQLLKDQGLWTDQVSVQTYSTPRRLWLYSPNLPEKSADTKEERRGPRADAPEKAVAGFLKSAGLPREKLEERQEKKGLFLYATIEKLGQPAQAILAAALPGLISGFRWPKSMHWGEGGLRWVRPLRSILCLLDDKLVDFEVGGLQSGNTTKGHSSLGGAEITIESFADYIEKLSQANVILMRHDRRGAIEGTAQEVALSEGLEIVEDPALFDEVAGLVEWPVVLFGSFDKAFLDLPPEVLISEMRNHQKYFALKDPATGALAPLFIFVSNIQAGDSCKVIRNGNERVLAARLSDARFFWDQDRKTRLKEHAKALGGIVFHEKLGSVADRVKRIEGLVKKIAKFVPDANKRKAVRAARLAKADLVTGMVGEFPELQGVMGGYYAAAEGEDEAISKAIREHYAPRGPADPCPSDPLSVTLALADKLDLLISMFAIGEKPTGSKDPFALRRAALGVIRLITENDLRIGLMKDLKVSPELMAFIAERLKVQQREKGVRHDLVDAAFSLSGEDDLVRLLARVSALQTFLSSADGDDLIAGFKRAINIVRIEEKKDGASYGGRPNPKLFSRTEEHQLNDALQAAMKKSAEHIVQENFAAAMAEIAVLRAPIDAFFDQVTVNAEDAELRSNRLRLLNQIRASLNTVADFSKIEN